MSRENVKIVRATADVNPPEKELAPIFDDKSKTRRVTGPISYAIDVYRGDFPAEQSLVRYATYVSFFPQMISGPICRAGSLIPQLRSVPAVTGSGESDLVMDRSACVSTVVSAVEVLLAVSGSVVVEVTAAVLEMV